MVAFLVRSAALFLTALLVSGVDAQLKVESDKLNVVANYLEGDWKPLPELSKRLFGRERGGPIGAFDVISFQSEPRVLQRLPAKLAEKLKNERVYFAGYMRLDDKKEYPFFLLTFHGNPYIVYFIPKGDDHFSNAESFNVFVAVAKERDNDILLLGSESIPRPFSAYERVKNKK